MSDLQKYIKERFAYDTEFAQDFDEGFADFKLGVLLRQAREKAGLTQQDIAQQIGAPASTVSKIENHAEDVRLTLIRRYAEALGKNVYISVS
jgi:HTH-type transcriptional regulator / antitoxin HipB